MIFLFAGSFELINMGDRDLSRDEEVVELTRRFKTFLMENKERYGYVWGQVTSAKFQWMSCVDKSGKRVTVCPLCYRRGTHES